MPESGCHAVGRDSYFLLGCRSTGPPHPYFLGGPVGVADGASAARRSWLGRARTFWPGKDLTSPSPASSSPSPARRESPLFIRAGLGLGGDAQLGAGRKPKKRRERGPWLRTLSRPHARGSPCALLILAGDPQRARAGSCTDPPSVCGACLQSLPGRSGARRGCSAAACSPLRWWSACWLAWSACSPSPR